MYPGLHPKQQQSQVDPESPNLSKFPNYANIKGYEVVLNEGDLLYLPPLWFHHVTALDPSISINFWSPDISQSETERKAFELDPDLATKLETKIVKAFLRVIQLEDVEA